MTCFSKVFHAKRISMHMSLNGTEHLYSDNLLELHVFYEMSCTWSVRILAFPKGSEELYAYEAALSC
jgi:hypothetical protein